MRQIQLWIQISITTEIYWFNTFPWFILKYESTTRTTTTIKGSVLTLNIQCQYYNLIESIKKKFDAIMTFLHTFVTKTIRPWNIMSKECN